MQVDVILEAGLPGRGSGLAVQAERYGIRRCGWQRSRRGAIRCRRSRSRRVRRGASASRRCRSAVRVHPLRLADQLLTLNELSQGRASILIGGLGHSVSRVTGLQADAARHRGARHGVHPQGPRPDAQPRLPRRALQP